MADLRLWLAYSAQLKPSPFRQLAKPKNCSPSWAVASLETLQLKQRGCNLSLVSSRQWQKALRAVQPGSTFSRIAILPSSRYSGRLLTQKSLTLGLLNTVEGGVNPFNGYLEIGSFS